jgi:hypothetical protein
MMDVGICFHISDEGVLCTFRAREFGSGEGLITLNMEAATFSETA